MSNSPDRVRVEAEKPGLKIMTEEGVNAEPPPHLLDPDITPADRMFVRNNGTLPEIDASGPETWTLRLTGCVETERTWTLEEIREGLPQVTEVAVLECAGNGRRYFNDPTHGLSWGNGAVACGEWTGVRLADLLAAAGLKPAAVYTAHHSPDRAGPIGEREAISRGIPIAKALAPETLVAHTLNGAPLPFLHGGPLRLIVPGFPGSAWQKWLNWIELRDREHDGPKMTGLDYRLPRRPVSPADPGAPDLYDPILDMPVKALVTTPA
jgi:DMSO/TMAO reductase YedYZ molybdopterin-dependent catalytic subunit